MCQYFGYIKCSLHAPRPIICSYLTKRLGPELVCPPPDNTPIVTTGLGVVVGSEGVDGGHPFGIAQASGPRSGIGAPVRLEIVRWETRPSNVDDDLYVVYC